MNEVNQPDTASSSCSPRLLPDVPVQDEANEAFGPHRRIAAAIANLIRVNEGGKAIALTGSWGSGKSSVIELLRNRFKRENKTDEFEAEVFVFDSWAHQGDPLRRSFLEELHAFLKDKDWTKCKIVEKQISQLGTIRTKGRTHSRPSFTWTGALLAISLPIALAANALLSCYGFKNESAFSLWGITIMPWWALLPLGLSPLLVLLVGGLAQRFGTKQESDSGKQNESFNLLAMLIQKTVEVQTTTTKRAADPTSVEFRKLFLSLLDEVLAKPYRHLVITLDNLDRIDARDALEIWATMRTFIDPNIAPNNPGVQRLWVIVPIDVKALGRLWILKTSTAPGSPIAPTVDQADEATAEEQAETEAQALPQTQTSDGLDRQVGIFMDKIFQVTFHVSPPVSTLLVPLL